MRNAIVRKPAPNFGTGLTTAQLGVPDYERALEQHQAYCKALEQCGLALTRLESDDRYPDSTFVEDTAVLAGECAIITRPGAATRAGEVTVIARTINDFFSRIETIQEPGTLDGGDVCEAGSHFFIGISERTSESGAVQLSRVLRSLGRSSSLVDIQEVNGLLHLKSGIGYLGDNRLAVIDALAERQQFGVFELVRVNPGEDYAANCVRINEYLLIAAGFPGFAAAVKGLGYKTIELEMTEFEKMDGGLSCLSLRF